MKTRRIEIRVTEEFAQRLDEARGDVTMTRFVERALEAALGGPDEEHEAGSLGVSEPAGDAPPAPSSKPSDPYQERMAANLRDRRKKS